MIHLKKCQIDGILSVLVRNCVRERERGKSGAARVLVDDLRDVNRALNRLNLRHVHRDLNHLFNMNGWKNARVRPYGREAKRDPAVGAIAEGGQ